MKTAILVTARLKSSRLTRKILRPIQGRPLICHVLDRLKLVQSTQEIIICTSPIAQDDALAQIAEEENVQCFRGDPEDVLMRLRRAAEAFSVDLVVDCTGATPFIEPEYVDKLVEFHLQSGDDFSRMAGLPLGASAAVVSYAALAKTCDIKGERDTLQWHDYFTRADVFTWGELHVDDPAVSWPDLRLAVDTAEDLEFATAVFGELYEPGAVFRLGDVVKLCRSRPDLVAINASVTQRTIVPVNINPSKLRRMTGYVKIADYLVGSGNPCFIIAEAGVNHNGDVALARKLVDAAVRAGADAVKFQTFKAERLVSATAPKARYQLKSTDESESQLEMLQALELSKEAHVELAAYCWERGIVFLSSPFDEESADLLEALDVPAFKIPSGEITNLPYLAHIARKGKPMIVSTGMSDLGEVGDAVSTIEQAGAPDLVLLHCVSSYPARPADINLLAMGVMARAFGRSTGYSDHVPTNEIAFAAVALGACVIEKHFTLDRALPGPDHKASVEPHELAELVHGIRAVEAARGSGRKVPVPSEIDTANVARKSLVSAQDIPEGTTLEDHMVTAMRPGTGLPPRMRPYVIGRRTRGVVPAGTMFTFDMLT
ncbi:MAG: N-acetylneuraminate synthase [Lentisphaerae bacterium]|jgi:N,N'-diacetyllegionaminate synthase|nr:N-acetylneuraminate synthase [Lentisphaerota bacterium]MBT4817291.1 N-acetylneuraminate synthase [Lentisphaerota bacterium]MBT5607724.1 N-acetylneuraminate synthase [Lentisphaerota bacterium]MBT7054887.1 N-acetylneuraminate synthase [Lentisphaerota bacterium]MBT7843343.1 N-acetylneuraminate synthase [Lentisphaerota bacterium]